MSDKRDDIDADVDDVDADPVNDDVDSVGDDIGVAGTRSQTAVATRPQRPTGKRSRREATGSATPDTEAGSVKNGDGKKPKTAKKQSGPSRNPLTFIWNYLKQVIAELRKVIWPNRKQMISYTTVVLVFLAFMVALIGGVDLGLAKLVTLVFG
ncbi:MAG: preprotein translocase, SecE subunit [Mycobacterium sp.]|nr:preprotein translocase, SecE subunit [Mycobacterium sp.]